jgi:hypothetical protein
MIFKWRLTLKFPDGNQITRNFEPLIWYKGPKMFVDEKGQYLLSWYDDEEEYEVWLLIRNPEGIKSYITNEKSLKQFISDGETFIVIHDPEYDIYHVKKQICSPEEDLVPPSDNSFLGNLYNGKEELLKINSQLPSTETN